MAISNTFANLREKGIRDEIKHTPIITAEEEDLLWAKGILGTRSPLQLLRAA